MFDDGDGDGDGDGDDDGDGDGDDRQARKPNRKPVYYYAVGYIGVDCSLDASLPPVIIGLRTGPVCDVRGPNPCTFISIFLAQFTFIDTFSCRFVCIYVTSVLLTVNVLLN